MLKIFKKNFNPREHESLRFWLANKILKDELRSFIAVDLQCFVMHVNSNVNDLYDVCTSQDYSETFRIQFGDVYVSRIKDDEEALGKRVHQLVSI